MISVIIATYKEEETIGRAIECLAEQDVEEEMEILVICPDKGTANVVKEYKKKYPFVKHIPEEDQGYGNKTAALNQCLKVAKGDKLIMTDGDVYVSNNSIKELTKRLNKPGVGAVTGRPISVSPRNTMLGYFSHLLADIGAHDTKVKYIKQGKFIDCAGYLYIMKRLFDEIPTNSIIDDAVVSHMIKNKGYKIDYAPKAKVYVKYPTNFKDWIKQKKRNSAGYNKLKQNFPEIKRMRSFTAEVKEGWYKPFTYPRNLTEFIWTICLYFARAYLWAVTFWDLSVNKERFKKNKDIWLRPESTK